MRDKIDYQAYTEAVLFTTPLHTIALIIQAVQTHCRFPSFMRICKRVVSQCDFHA